MVSDGIGRMVDRDGKRAALGRGREAQRTEEKIGERTYQ